MHQFHRGLERRLQALEIRLGAVPTIETDAETARRLTLCRAALAGEIPEDLTATEKLTFSKITASVSVFQELLDDGALDDFLDGDPHEPVWRP